MRMREKEGAEAVPVGATVSTVPAAAIKIRWRLVLLKN
jgi:hypothetical protein